MGSFTGNLELSHFEVVVDRGWFDSNRNFSDIFYKNTEKLDINLIRKALVQ